MSVQTLYTAATGMSALETKLDVIANNMANINTTAFKKDRANFEDLFYRQLRLPGATDADGNMTATGIEEPTWNFTKYLVGRDGRVIARFGPRTAPDDAELRTAIEAALSAVED